MYRIALCDDERAELEKTEKLLGEYQKRHPGLHDGCIAVFKAALIAVKIGKAALHLISISHDVPRLIL